MEINRFSCGIRLEVAEFFISTDVDTLETAVSYWPDTDHIHSPVEISTQNAVT